MKNYYFLQFKDVGKTHNINLHTYETIAYSKEEAIGKALTNTNLKFNDLERILERTDKKETEYFYENSKLKS